MVGRFLFCLMLLLSSSWLAYSFDLVKLFSKAPSVSDFKNGDIIFQTSLSAQSTAIQLATASPYSHCGIVYIKDGKCYVCEASSPKVKLTPIEQWITRGKNKHYIVKRLHNADTVLTKEVLEKMCAVAESFQGKPYDSTFEWSDKKMYCSELVWKIYKRGANIELGTLQRLAEFDLSTPIVRDILSKRYGKSIPTNQQVISPNAIFITPQLTTIAEG